MTAEAVRATGITVLAEGGGEPVADILFVHGVQGHPERTWTHTKSSRLSLGNLARFPRKSSLQGATSTAEDRAVTDTTNTNSASLGLSSADAPKDVFWPRDLLRHDCADTRIITYGYDSHISGFFKASANQDGIYQHARKLMHALKHERKQVPRRPLIIIAHSLGGIIVKEMLLQASDVTDPSSRNIYMSVHAIMFFGTPHRGSELATYGQTVERVVSMLGFATNKSLLHDLQPNGQMLEKIRFDFLKLLRNQDNQTQIFSFQENRGLSKMRFASRKVVENVSSTLDFHREQVDTIDADHQMMCRFHGPSDEGYRQTSRVVQAYLEEIRKSAADAKQVLVDVQTMAAAQCAESLRYRGMFDRQNQMKQAEEHTFKWIFDNSKTGFKSWLQDDEGLFWINGKPGSGKSTLMKYLYDDMKWKCSLKLQKYNQTAVAGFFFSNRALSRREDTFTHFLRSILCQILSQVEGLFITIKDVSRAAQDIKGHYSWTQPLLEAAFRQIHDQTNVSASIYLYIDALDEYEGKLADIATFLKRLGKNSDSGNVRFKICAASRPISTLHVIFKETPQLRMQDWTDDDIQLVIKNKLGVSDTRHMSELALEILQRSEGVFLWVNLVLERLIEEIFAGESLESLISMIGDFPQELEAFYQQSIARIPPTKFATTRIMLELAICGWGRLVPLTLAEFSLAVLLPDQYSIQHQSLKCSPTEDFERCREMEKRIKTCCGGLLEIVPNQFWDSSENRPPQSLYAPLTMQQYRFTMSKVQFIHRTASEFVLGMHNNCLLGLQDTNESVVSGNLRLMRLYIYLAADRQGSYFLYTANGSYLLNRNYFTEYSIFNTLLFDHFCAHARDIECTESNQGSANVATIPFQGRRLITGKSNKGREIIPGIASSDEIWKFGEDMEKIMRVKSDLIDMFNVVLCKSAGEDWIRQWHTIPLFKFGMFDPPPETFMDFAIIQGLFSHVKDALDISKASVTKANLNTYLRWAIMNLAFIFDQLFDFDLDLRPDDILRFEKFIGYLLKMGADPNSRFNARSAKPITGDNMDERMEEFFAGDLVNPVSISILQHALRVLVDDVSSSSNPAFFSVIQQLVSAGADVNELMLHHFWEAEARPADAQARTPLHYLLYVNTVSVNPPEAFSSPDISEDMRALYVKNIISRWDEIAAKKWPNQLFFEFPIEAMATIKSFLDHGADPNATDSEGFTVVEYAFKNGYSEVVELLLERGGLITTKMLEPDGKPSADTNGVLRRYMWMTNEFYTEEAWEKAKDFVEATVALEKGKGKELAIWNC